MVVALAAASAAQLLAPNATSGVAFASCSADATAVFDLPARSLSWRLGEASASPRSLPQLRQLQTLTLALAAEVQADAARQKRSERRRGAAARARAAGGAALAPPPPPPPPGRRQRRRDARVRSRQLREIGEGASAASCMGVVERDLAAATQALSDEIGTEMLATHQEEMFTGMISAIVGVLAAPLTENVMPRGGNLIVGLIVMIMTLEMALPLAVGLAHAFVHTLASALCVLLTEALQCAAAAQFSCRAIRRNSQPVSRRLRYKLTTLLLAGVEKDAVPELTAMLGNTILRWMRVDMTPAAALMVSNFLIATLPNALAEAVSEAVARLITPTLTQSLATPVMNYYYCMYCYYYGDYCQYCFYNKDLDWLRLRWWLGGDLGATDT